MHTSSKAASDCPALLAVFDRMHLACKVSGSFRPMSRAGGSAATCEGISIRGNADPEVSAAAFVYPEEFQNDPIVRRSLRRVPHPKASPPPRTGFRLLY